MEEQIDIEVNLGKELADKLNKMSKKELLNRLCVMILRNKVQDEEASKLDFEFRTLESKLQRMEEYNGQAEAMLSAITERWHTYTGG